MTPNDQQPNDIVSPFEDDDSLDIFANPILLSDLPDFGETQAAVGTELEAGDAAIVYYQEDTGTTWSVVLLKDIDAGTEFSFTDNGWTSGGTFRVGESSGLTFTAGQALSAGTVITFSGTTAVFAGTNTSAGTVTGDPLDFSDNGANGQDQVFMYQGSFDNTTGVVSADFQFVTAYHGNGAWNADAIDDETSARPMELNDFSVDQSVLGQEDNAVYAGPQSGTISQIWANIRDQSNWIGDRDPAEASLQAAFNALAPFTIVTGDPVVTTPTGLVFEVDSTDNIITGLSVSDPDSDRVTVTITVEGTVTLAQTTDLNFMSGDGIADSTMEFSGMLDDVNAALDGLLYTPAVGDTDGDLFQISVSDGSVTIAPGSFSGTIDLANLDGTDGFAIDGLAQTDRLGYDVASVGDINGDGIDDIIVGAPYADNGVLVDHDNDPMTPMIEANTGEAYVIYGTDAGFNSSFDLTTIDGTNGFKITNVSGFRGDELGHAVTGLGDINGDGFDDFAVGSFNADEPNGAGQISDVGKTWVVFGTGADQPATLDVSTLNGTNGFTITGFQADDYAGRVVTSAGDVNGDGFEDILIGADRTDTPGNNAGGAYLIYGTDQGFSDIDLEDIETGDGSVGTYITAESAGDRLGRDVHAAGDVNGDGFDDIILGAYEASLDLDNDPLTPDDAGVGKAHVIFGSANGLGGTFNVGSLDGSNGFTMDGLAAGDKTGRAVSTAGDINGDGIDDIIVGAYGADVVGSESGKLYVVYGTTSGFAADIDLSLLDGTNGFVINGEEDRARSGYQIEELGDINGDGIDDVLIGGISGGNSKAGSYVLFGSDTGFGASISLGSLDGTNGFQLPDVNFGDRTGFSVSSAGDLNDDGINDLLIGAANADPNGNNSGKAYVVFGDADITEILTNASFAIELEQAPVIADLDGDSITYTEGGDPLSFDYASVQLSISDADSADFDGGSLTVSYSAFQAAEDRIVLTDINFGAVTLSDGQNAGSEVSVNGTVIGTIVAGKTGGESEDLEIAFNANATPARVELLFDALAYFNAGGDTPDTSAARTFDFTLSDGDGGDTTVSTTVQVQAVDDAPTLTVPAASSFAVNSSGNLLTGASVGDVDSPNVSVTLTAEGAITLAQTTGLTFDAGADGTSSMTITGTVADINLAIATLTYVPAADDRDGDTLSITVTDGTTPVNNTTAITLTNTDPVAQDDADAVNATETLAGNVLADNGNGADSDANGDALTVAEVNGVPANVGTQITLTSGALLTVNSDGSYSYDPNGAFNSLQTGQSDTDSFTYGVSDGFGGTDTATVILTINGQNVAPDAMDDVFQTPEDGPAINGDVFADNGAGIDSDPNGDPITVTAVNGEAVDVGQTITLPSGALLTLNSDGTFTYDPNGVFNGLADGASDQDSFTYTVSDGVSGTDTATATINIDGVNDNPELTVPGAQAFLANSNGNTISGITVDDADGDVLSVTLSAEGDLTLGQVTGLTFAGGANGTPFLAFTGQAADINAALATLSYTPAANDIDGDTLSVSVFDGLMAEADTITIDLTNLIPTANDDEMMSDDVSDVTGNVFDDNGNGVDDDGNGDTLTVSAVNGQASNVGVQITLASGALLTVNSDGSFSLLENGAYEGLLPGEAAIETFTYEASDGLGGTDTATATITIVGSLQGDDVISGTELDDELNGGADDDTLSGLGGNDVLNGNTGNDTLDGGSGNDTLNGANGNDILMGGEGDDTLNGDGGRDTIFGGDGIDTISGGNSDDDLFGDAGNDIISGGDRNDLLVGGDGDDDLSGDAGNDFLRGSTGDDMLNGGAGNDTLRGSQGNDTLEGGDGRDDLDGEGGNDILRGGDDDDDLTGGKGIDQLFGDAGSDDLSGGDDNDLLDGGAGADTIAGDDGDDYLIGGAGADLLRGSQGNDLLEGGSGADVLFGSTGLDDLFGGGGNDTLRGEGGDDKLYGQAGDDTLDGGQGDDTLNGGGGDDMLTGGAGNDTFIFDAAAIGTDTVTDFTSGDQVDLSSFGFADLADAQSNFAQDGADVMFTSGGVTVIFQNALLADVTGGITGVNESAGGAVADSFDFSALTVDASSNASIDQDMIDMAAGASDGAADSDIAGLATDFAADMPVFVDISTDDDFGGLLG